MKKVLLSFVLVMFFVSTGFAGVLTGDTLTNTSVNTNTNVNTNTAIAGAAAVSGSSSKVFFKPNTSLVSDIKIDNPLPAPEINPFNIPILQSGKVGDITEIMPNFWPSALTKLGKNDVVMKVLDVYTGFWFNRITWDEIEAYLLATCSNYNDLVKEGKKVRYSVKFNDSVFSGGVGGGLAGSVSGIDGASTGAFLPGAHRSTAEPKFAITYYLVQ